MGMVAEEPFLSRPRLASFRHALKLSDIRILTETNNYLNKKKITVDPLLLLHCRIQTNI